VLVAAGLLVHSMQNLQRVDPGFDSAGVLLFRVDPTLLGYSDERIRDLSSEVRDRLRALPGVRDATFSHIGLLYGWSSISSLDLVDGKPPASALDVNRLIIDPGFFRLFRIPVLAGRTFTGTERRGDVIPAVINRTFAEQAFKRLNAVGHTFKMSVRPNQPTFEVIGVVGDVRLVSLNRPVPPTMYFSYSADVMFGATFAVKAAIPPEQLIDGVRRTVAAIDPDLPVDRIRTQAAEQRHSLREERLFAALGTVLGCLALLLACVGIYGLMAYAVARRTQEIGVRMALGAERRRVLLMVVGEAARIAIIGIGLGLGGAFLSSRYLQSRLFGLTAADPASLIAATLLLSLALLAALIPALRASRVDPLVALRAE
jgi:predicted permease